MKHSSHCADGLRIFIKPTRHHVRRALLKNVVPRWTASARFIYCEAASSWITQQCRSTGELFGFGVRCQQPVLLKVNQMWVRWRAPFSQRPHLKSRADIKRLLNPLHMPLLSLCRRETCGRHTLADMQIKLIK